MTSTGCSVPSAVTMPVGVIRAMRSVISSVFGLAMPPIVVVGVEDSLAAGAIVRRQLAAQLLVLDVAADVPLAQQLHRASAARLLGHREPDGPRGTSRCPPASPRAVPGT